MFPSVNYFRDIPCPFFSRVGCPRPHCHFKHVSTSSQTSSVPAATPQSAPIHIPADANETLNKLITQLSSAATGNVPATSTTINPTPNVDFTSILQNTLLQSLTTVFASALNAVPQPLASTQPNEVAQKLTQAISNISTQLIPQPPAQSSSVVTSTTSDSIPEYRPTPIAELERRRRIQKTEPIDTDSNDYIQATFSPPSMSPSSTSAEPNNESVVQSKPKTQTLSKSSSSTAVDSNHLWISPPARKKLSSSSEHHDVDERKSASTKGVTSKVANRSGSTAVQSKPSSTTTTNPMLKPIPKKTATSKVRLADIDLDRVSVTSSLSFELDKEQNKAKTSPSLKRPSNGINEIPQKKPKLTPTNKMKKTLPNGTKKADADEKDDELALFDVAFPVATKPSVTKKVSPLNPVQQLTARYVSTGSSTSVASTSNSDGFLSNRVTRAETSNDGRRIAHQPKPHSTSNQSSTAAAATAPIVFQPLVDGNSSSLKIPYKTRQEYLNFFLNELKKRNTDIPSIQLQAQRIEKEIFDKSTNKNSYLNLAAKHVRQLRTDETKPAEQKKTATPRLTVSHSAMLTGGKTDNLSFSIKKTKHVDVKSLTENELYTLLLPYKASEQDLLENGYPAFSLDFPDKVLIKSKNPVYNTTIKLPTSDPSIRQCCRCSRNYRVNEDGDYLKAEECIYHWGRLRAQRVAGQIEKKYSCCQANFDAMGCAVSQYHVHNGDDSALLTGFVKTSPCRKSTTNPDESPGIFAIDCEMCYTVDGLELVRVSVINHKLQPILDTLVKPLNEILDYNTRWSGISEKDLKDCHVRLVDVQRRLLKFINEKTILIGHSLESDLKALKIVHETIIDTSLVFPHAKGKPYKRALKTITTEYLTKIIQERTDGHDSKEDAMACMELMLWKIKEDLKTTTVNR